MKQENIRNFCIIAHVDHGKSTLADRFLELTGTVEKRNMREQILDQMDLERERGITIKLQPVRMDYRGYILNLIDTPGHVDFSYEVSRSLACVEGAVLLVDASQGIQAQTLANLYLAMEQNLIIIPVINKIDLAAAQVANTKRDLAHLLGCVEDEIILASGKTGQGCEDILARIIEKVPSPSQSIDKPLRALIFDSAYDDYKGVVAYVRVVDGQIKIGEQILMIAQKAESNVVEVGVFKPQFKKIEIISAGEIGYIATGLKSVADCRVGDTITNSKFNPPAGGQNRKLTVESLPGYKEIKPMVFAGLFCKEGTDYQRLRESIEKLKLSDASLTFVPEHSPVLGFGFRCGFLGLLHLDIVQERLKREYGLDLVITVPSVAYRIKKKEGKFYEISNPLELPDASQIDYVKEPIMALDIFTPSPYLGQVMRLAQEKRAKYLNTEYLSEDRAILHYRVPLSALIVDFYDKLKSVSSGYASLNYDFFDYEPTEITRLDILVAEEPVEALAMIVYKDEAYKVGKQIVNKLKETIPRQQFMVKIQAALGGKIIAAERLSALRKDVTAKLYGGDVTRKRKLLEKQKKGKKKMMQMGKGKVEIPTQAFLEVLKR